MEKWYVATKRADFKELSKRFGIDQVTARIIRNRDITDEGEIDKYLNGTIDDLYPPEELKDVKKAVSILKD